MKAMILAAGRGERMRPLTDTIPKPLLPVLGKPLIFYMIEHLVKEGFTELIINHAHLGSQIENSLGNGQQFGANIVYSPEGETGLETAGGIFNALPLLGSEPFLVVNGDIATDFPFAILKNTTVDLAHLILIKNPEHHPEGDFVLLKNGLVIEEQKNTLTFSGIGVYRPELFKQLSHGVHKLGDLLRKNMKQHRVSGEYFDGFWLDIGTPYRLEQLANYWNH